MHLLPSGVVANAHRNGKSHRLAVPGSRVIYDARRKLRIGQRHQFLPRRADRRGEETETNDGALEFARLDDIARANRPSISQYKTARELAS